MSDSLAVAHRLVLSIVIGIFSVPALFGASLLADWLGVPALGNALIRLLTWPFNLPATSCPLIEFLISSMLC